MPMGHDVCVVALQTSLEFLRAISAWAPKDLMIYSIVLGVSVMMILYGVGRIVDSESYFRGGLAIALGEAGLVMFCRKVVAVLTSVGSNTEKRGS